MNKSFIFLKTLAILLFLGGQAIAKTQNPSEEMILILLHHKSGPNDLSVKGLPHDKVKEIPPKEEMAGYEVYKVPYPEGTADAFGYTVYLHTQSGQYWIYRWGGMGGTSNFYGPVLVKELRK